MSKPTDFIDPDFWTWYEQYGPSWILSHRLDILQAMYDAYEDTVVLSEGDNFIAVGLKSEVKEFWNEVNTLIDKLPTPAKKREKSISNTDIQKLRKALNDLKWRKEK